MNMTEFQREGLQLLGYTQRESEFLFVVATHSGYFTNHQFKSFTQTESGSVSHAFLRKLLERKHATFRAFRSGERVYHLFARKVYQAIERENLRTRKKHEVEHVKSRLVGLDFVLAHPEHHYLETETEKVSYFEKRCNIDRAVLPVKLYRARRSAEVTPRHFVDRFPIFLSQPCGPSVLTFTYIDSGAVALDGFETHLRAYAGLFQALPAFEFVYIAPTVRLFRAAESAFQKVVNGRGIQGKKIKLLEYFRLRKAWDGRERVASADVILLKEAQELYVGKQVDELYELWRIGSAKDSDVMRLGEQPLMAAKAVFRTLICGGSLKVFADKPASPRETCRTTGVRGSEAQVSTNSSIQVSGQ